jgi:hypothetical protein
MMVAVLVIVALPSMICFHRWLGGLWGLLGLVPAALVAMPVDKMLDEKYRTLKPIGNQDRKPDGAR